MNRRTDIEAAVRAAAPHALLATLRTQLSAAYGALAVELHLADWTRAALFLEGVARAAARLGTTPVPPGTLVGVAALDVPEHLVEVEATAVLDS
ncbi:hypothetical protein SBADM41S_04108 [Streptomyces badius]